MTASFKLNFKGGREVLNEVAAPIINAIAQGAANYIGDEAEFEPYTTDRAAASVRVPADMQAKDGVLTRAAAAAGLEVREK